MRETFFAILIVVGLTLANCDKTTPDPEEPTPAGRTLFLLKVLKHKLKQQVTPIKIPTTPSPRGCICVPYYLCSINNTIISFGPTAIDIRYRPCTGDLEVCCYPGGMTTMTRVVNPTQSIRTTVPTTPPTTIPTTIPTTPPSTVPTTRKSEPVPPTIPTPGQYYPPPCICMPTYQCFYYQNQNIYDNLQLVPRYPIIGSCGIPTFVCCGIAMGPGQNFPPYELPNQLPGTYPPGTQPPVTQLPPTSSTGPRTESTPPRVTLPPTSLPPTVSIPGSGVIIPTYSPPFIVGQSCLCVPVPSCNIGYITVPGGQSHIDPRLLLNRQLALGTSCSGVSSMCCRTISGYQDYNVIPNVISDNPVGPYLGDIYQIKNPGTPDVCTCMPVNQCGELNAVTYSGGGVLDPRFGPCQSSTLVCCRILQSGRADIIPDISNNGPNIVNPGSGDTPTAPSCGVPDRTYFKDNLQNGETYFAEFPWMVMIIMRRPGKKDVFECPGSMINNRAVLTAAHCVQGCFIGNMVVRFGEYDTFNTSEPLPYQETPVQTAIIHPQYYSTGLYNDVAILILLRPVNYAINVRPICLPTQGQTFSPGKVCYASGWGRSAFGSGGHYQTVLRKVDLPIIARDDCERRLRSTRLGANFVLHSSFMCAGGEQDKDTCYKDGGGPLVCEDENRRFTQAGIVSWGIGCGSSKVPGVYVNVAQFREWIDQQLKTYGLSA